MNARQRNQAKLNKKKAAAGRRSSGGRYTPPTRARAAIVSTGFGLLALAQATPAVAAEPSGAVTWAQATSQGRAQPDAGLSGVVDLAAKVSTDQPVDGWSLAVLDEAGQPAFGTVCEREFPRPQDEFGVLCRWDTTRGPDKRPSANRRYLVRLSTLEDGALTPAGPDRPVGLANLAAAPADVTIAYDRAGSGVTLSWAPNAEPDVDHYDVEQNVDGRGWARVGTPTGTTFEHAVSEPGEHRYRVAAERRGPDGTPLGPGQWAGPSNRPRPARAGAAERPDASSSRESRGDDRRGGSRPEGAGQSSADRGRSGQSAESGRRNRPDQNNTERPNPDQNNTERRQPRQDDTERPKPDQNNTDRRSRNQSAQSERRNAGGAGQESADRRGAAGRSDQTGAPNRRPAESPGAEPGPTAEGGAERRAGATAGGPREGGRAGASSGASSTPAGPPPADRSPVAFPASSTAGFAALRAPVPTQRVAAHPSVTARPKAVPAPDPGFQERLPYPSMSRATPPEASAPEPGPANGDPAEDLAAAAPAPSPADLDPGAPARAHSHRPTGAGLLVLAGGLLATAIRPVPRRRTRSQAQTAVSPASPAPTPLTSPTPATPDTAALLERIARLEALLEQRPAPATAAQPDPSTESNWYAELF